MNRDQLKRLKEFETENQRLWRAVTYLTLADMAEKPELGPDIIMKNCRTARLGGGRNPVDETGASLNQAGKTIGLGCPSLRNGFGQAGLS
jgi:hypothetical protein